MTMLRLFLVIAIVALLTVIVLAMQRSGPRVTEITRRRDREHEDREDGNA